MTCDDEFPDTLAGDPTGDTVDVSRFTDDPTDPAGADAPEDELEEVAPDE